MKKKQLLKKNTFLKNNKLLASAILTSLLFTVITGLAQTPDFHNGTSGTSSNTFPLASTTNRVQWIYTPYLFKSGGTSGTAATSGMIDKVYFRLGSRTGTTTYSDFTISLAQNVGTAATWSSASWATSLTQCFYRSSYTFSSTSTYSWYEVKLDQPFSYDPSQSLVFEIKTSSTSGSNYMAQNNSGGSKRRWGTYSGTSGSSYGSGLVDFGFDLLRGSNDAGIAGIRVPTCSPEVIVSYGNFGINKLDSAKINWSVNGVTQTQNSYNTALNSGGNPVDVTLTPNYNFVDGNTYTVKVWTSNPNGKNDTLNTNDTTSITFQYMGPAGTPTTYDAVKCGPGKAPLKATTAFATDSVIWYDAATGGQVIAKGKNAFSPPLFLGANTFYAQSFKISGNNKFANDLMGNYTYYTTGRAAQGGYADITPKTDLFLDSFRIRLYYNNPGSTYSIYMRTGSYLGYQTSAAGWTQIVNNAASSLTTIGGYYIATLAVPELMLNKGTTYGFCILSTGTNPVWTFQYNSAGHTTSNDDLTLFTQHYFYGSAPFSGYWSQGYSINLEANYRVTNCPTNRVPIKITVNPSPNGAGFEKGTPFQTMQPNTTGTLSSPDIVAKGDVITWELTPPTGYNNSDFGSTWITGTPMVLSKAGYPIDSKYWTWNPPSGSSLGKFTFKPDQDVVDSLYTVSLQIRDLGPYYCDSTITRNIFVAPRPVPDFKFNSPICDGDAVVFNDASSISSGGLTYKYDFNTGNPADTSTINSSVFTFPTHGIYNVTLTTVSTPYGYKESKTIQVVVTEIPKIGFKVLNACEKVPVSFNNTTTIGFGSIVYAWDFGDPSTTLDRSTAEHPTYTYADAGAYKVTLRASASGCTSELTKNANQFSVPDASFTVPSLICDKSDIQFTNTSTIKMGNMGYSWNFGDGGVSNFANPVHQYATSTSKQVKMKAVSEFGCVDSVIRTLTMAEAPNADFTWGPACNLSNTDFTFTGTKPSGALTSFNWNFAGEGTTTIENPSKLFSIVGKKMVTLTLLSNNGCKDVITKEVNVKLQSKADFVVADVCEDDDAVFTNKSSVSQGNLQFTWKFGDATTSNAQSPRHRYSIGGVSQTFNVTLVAIVPGGCSDSINQPVSVNAKPKSDFTFTTSGRRVFFTASQAGNTSYYWRFGDGGNSTSATTQYDYLNYPTGTYLTCLAVVNAAGCFSETCKEVSITGGIEELESVTGLKVYPNPNKGNFTIKVEDPKSDISIVIYNLMGEVVKVIDANPLKSVYSVELNAANGVYLVKVTNGGMVSTQKLTLNK